MTTKQRLDKLEASVDALSERIDNLARWHARDYDKLRKDFRGFIATPMVELTYEPVNNDALREWLDQEIARLEHHEKMPDRRAEWLWGQLAAFRAVKDFLKNA